MKRRILKRPPAFLFRYRPPSEVAAGHLEDLLRENRIWASPPRGFSDPYDCRARIDFEGTRSEYLRYWNHVFKRLRLKGKARSRAASQAVATGAWKDPNKHDEIALGIQANLDNSGVICLTDTPIDERMWVEYAKDHSGVCLCFESSEAPFSLTYDVTYLPEHPMVRFNADSEEQMEAFLLTKRSSYSWEREWRFVDFNRAGGYKPISPAALQAIVLGRDMEATTREEVLRLVARWKPDITLFVIGSASSGSGLRLQPLAQSRTTTAAPITPPILVRPTHDPLEGSQADLLLEHLDSITASDRRKDLHTRLERLAVSLSAVRASQGRRQSLAAAGALAAVREARDLLRELVDVTGDAIPGYGKRRGAALQARARIRHQARSPGLTT